MISQPQPALAAEAPVHAAIATRDTRNMPIEMPFERGRPGHQLEPQPVVDHGEAAGGQGETPAIGARDMLAACSPVERQAGLMGKPLGQITDLALAQPVEQPAREDHAAVLSLSQSLLDQVLRAPLHRLAHLDAEAGLRKRHGIARDRLPIEPGGAIGGDLGADVQVRTNSQRDTSLATRILVRPQLDDGAGRAIAGGVETRQPDMMAKAALSLPPLRLRMWRTGWPSNNDSMSAVYSVIMQSLTISSPLPWSLSAWSVP